MYLPEYHTYLFGYMDIKIKKGFYTKRDANIQGIVKFYVKSSDNLSGSTSFGAMKFISALQGRIENELRKIVSTKGIYYWLHLYRRIAPVASMQDESPQTVLLYRNILETAFIKYGSIECGNEIIYSSHENPIEVKVIANGLYLEALKYFGVNEKYNNNIEGIFLGNFGYNDLMQICQLERLAYEYWYTTMCARRIYKGGILLFENDKYYVRNDYDTTRLMHSYDNRCLEEHDITGSEGILLEPVNFSNGSTLIPIYNVDQLTLEENPIHKVFLRFDIDTNVIMNFVWIPFDFDYYYLTHQFFNKEFKHKFKYSIECFSYTIYLICMREIYFCQNDERIVGTELMKRAYRHFNNLDSYIDHLFEMSGIFKLPSLGNYILDKCEVKIALDDLTLKENRKGVSLLTMGPRPLIIPSVNNGFNVDYAAIYFIMTTKTHFLRPIMEEKGHQFEDAVIERLNNANTKLWECKKKLSHNDGTEKEIDVSFLYKNILFIEALKEVEEKADWLILHTTGSNYSIPCSISCIVPFVVMPDVEYIWGADKYLWITKDIPRICTPSECCKLCNDEVVNQIINKPYIRYLAHC